ncbi:uncharacterized protein TNCV_5141881 [Trichonephila clavipes]|nr:uncharacterized protein TNCV_5141881 [Trichonephila clavipes]
MPAMNRYLDHWATAAPRKLGHLIGKGEIKAHEIHHGKGLVVFGSVEHHPGDTTRGLLATDHVILSHGQVTWTTPELATPSPTTPHQRQDVSALDRFNVHRCPTRRVFSGTGLELLTKQATIRCLYHSATAATMSCPRFESRPYGTAVNVANHYTGWVTMQYITENIVAVIYTDHS